MNQYQKNNIFRGVTSFLTGNQTNKWAAEYINDRTKPEAIRMYVNNLFPTKDTFTEVDVSVPYRDALALHYKRYNELKNKKLRKDGDKQLMAYPLEGEHVQNLPYWQVGEYLNNPHFNLRNSINHVDYIDEGNKVRALDTYDWHYKTPIDIKDPITIIRRTAEEFGVPFNIDIQVDKPRGN